MLGLALLSLVLGQSAPATAAGHRQLTLSAPGEVPEGAPVRTCSDAPRICLTLEPAADGRLVGRLEPGPDAPAASRAPLALGAVADGEGIAPWQSLVVEAGGAIVFGVERAQRTGFSGGGMVVHRLTLHRFDPATGAAAELLELPIAGAASIRACFDADDARRRRDQCLDEYDFEARLDLDGADAAGRPVFTYASHATTYPGRRSRDADSTTAPPLRAADLVEWTDPVCSFRRTFVWDAAAGRYSPDAPLPACADYLEF